MQSLRTRLLQRVQIKQGWGCYGYCTARVLDPGQPTAYSHPEDADYLCITGCQQPDGIAVLGHDIGLCMFMPEPSIHDVTWQGHIAGVHEALHGFKADQAFPMSKLNEENHIEHFAWSESVLCDGSSSYLCRCFLASYKDHLAYTTMSKHLHPVYKDLEAFQKAYYDGKVKDVSVYTHDLRWVKSPAEISLMRDSASVACQALLQTMLHSKVYPHERMLAAKVEYECKMRGAQRMAFNSVVGGGANASVIHYSRNDQKVKDGDLVLMDIGCELHGYVSDLTRTWPPSGRFSSAHVELYNLMLETSKECLKLCRPGISIREIHNHSVEMLHTGLKQIGILKGDRSSCQKYHQLNPTNIGHYLGMDVHDCSSISNDCPLEPGVIITIEPGIYIPTVFDCPERYGTPPFCYQICGMPPLTTNRCKAPNPNNRLHLFKLWSDRHSVFFAMCSSILFLGEECVCKESPDSIFSEAISQRYHGVGIRIEDDVLITDSGYEVLTGSMPKKINHIESLLNTHLSEPDFLRTATSS